MKTLLSLLIVLLCFSFLGYGADSQINNDASIRTLINEIKQSKNSERKKALGLLKQKLKGMRRTERRRIMTKLRNLLSTTQNTQYHSASEILGAFGSNHGSMGQNGSSASGESGSGNGHGGGGDSGGGNGGGGGHGGR